MTTISRQSSVKSQPPDLRDNRDTKSAAPDNKAQGVLEPITKLKYTDLVYLLNILKLQAAKKNDNLA